MASWHVHDGEFSAAAADQVGELPGARDVRDEFESLPGFHDPTVDRVATGGSRYRCNPRGTVGVHRCVVNPPYFHPEASGYLAGAAFVAELRGVHVGVPAVEILTELN